MTTTIQQLGASDYDELIPFLGRCFNKDSDAWFAANLPACYQPTDASMQCNHAIRDNGQLAAVVGVFPMSLHIGGATLKCAGIGGVSTSQEARGKGYMKSLLNHVAALIDEQGYHLSWLGGQRQRYRHFGWERGGQNVFARIGPRGMKHEKRLIENARIELRALNEVDESIIASLHDLHDAQPMYCERSGNSFEVRLKHWSCVPLVGLDYGGRPLGYAVMDLIDGTQAVELVARDENAALGLIGALITEYGREIKVKVPCVPSAFGQTLRHMAEDVEIGSSGNWRLYDVPKVLAAMLQAKADAKPLMDGRMVINVTHHSDTGGAAICLALEHTGGRASCAATDEQPDVTLSACQVVAALCGVNAPSEVIGLPKHAAILDAWCPLPLTLNTPDEC